MSLTIDQGAGGFVAEIRRVSPSPGSNLIRLKRSWPSDPPPRAKLRRRSLVAASGESLS